MKTLKRINVLITGLGGGAHGMEVLKALRSSDLPYFFVGTDITKASYGLSLVDKQYIVPPAVHADYLGTLLDIVRKNEIHVVIHGSEPELKVLSNNREVFEAEGVFLPINNRAVIDLCMNKFSLTSFLQSKGIRVPATFLISSLGDIEQVGRYPLVCKPHIGGGGSSNVYLIQNSRELHSITEYLLGYLDTFIIQEYVGTPYSEYTVGVLSDAEGKVIDSIAVRRYLLSALSSRMRVPNRTTQADLGTILVISNGISQGEIGRFSNVTGFCEQIAGLLNSTGPLNFQCRVHRGEVYIFEINPRFSGTTNLRAMAGFNEPDLLIRKYVLHEQLREGRINYKEGTILRALSEQFVDVGSK